MKPYPAVLLGLFLLLCVTIVWVKFVPEAKTEAEAEAKTRSARPTPIFAVGQMIKAKLDGRVGQIVYVGDFIMPITYRVRFETKNAPIKPQTLGPSVHPGDFLYVTVELREFEIEGVKP